MTGGAGTVTYQWLADGEDILGANKATLFVDDDYVGSKLSVEVTDEDGNTAVSDETARVTADKSEDVKIIDKMGLQSDGTAIIGDRLALSYGVTFGTPTAITWYKDGSVLKTWSSGNSGNDGLNQDGGLYKDVKAGDGAGTYSATVVAEGVTYTTNEIVVTTAEEAATITGFYFEDDYTDGTDIVYNTKDNKAVATVTLKKNYDGKLIIYKANDNKFKGKIDTVNTSTTVATSDTKTYVSTDEGGKGAEIRSGSVLTTDQATNFQVENLETAGAAVGHINADGSVTYKFVVDDGVLTRGQDYVVAFDQASVVGDTPGTGIANVFEDEATVPYVEEPAAIAVTKVSAGNYPEVSFVDEDGNTLQWFGESTKQLSTSGIAEGEIYYATSKLNDPKKGTKQGVNIALAGNVEKGVWKSNVKAANIIDAYWFASVTTTKGIFGEAAVTLTSEAVPVAQKSADTINLVEDSTTATSGTVKFTNLRAGGTVYIVRGLKERTEDGKGDDNWDGTDYFSTPANVFKAYEAGINEAIVGRTTVEAGDASVTVAQTIDEFETKAEDGPDDALGEDTAGYFPVNNYIAVFVPDDEDNYGMIYTADGFKNEATKENGDSTDDSQGLSLTQVPTTLTYDKTVRATITQSEDNDTLTITGTKLIAKDQFGKQMATATAAADVTSATFTPYALSEIEQGVVGKYSVANNGVTTIVLTTKNGVKATAKDKYTVTLLGATITLEALATVTDADRDADESELVWNAKFGSDNLIDNDDVVTLAGLSVSVATNASSGKTEFTVSGTAGMVTAATSAEGKVSVTTSGRKVTASNEGDGSATVSVIITLNDNTRTLEYTTDATNVDPVIAAPTTAKAATDTLA